LAKREGSSLRPPSLEPLRLLLRPLVRLLSALGLGPNAITALGCALSLVSAGLFATGSFRAAGAVMLLGGMFDALDGAVARELGRTSGFGAFLDSTLDRVSESAILAGLVFAFAAAGRPYAALAAAAAMAFSLLTSYTRSRAETLGYDCNVGLLGRAGRVAILGLSSLAGAPLAGTAVIAAGAAATTVQRVLHVRRLHRVRLSRGNVRGGGV